MGESYRHGEEGRQLLAHMTMLSALPRSQPLFIGKIVPRVRAEVGERIFFNIV